jgi:hypothetical protein
MGHLNLEAMLKVRAAVASVGLQWTREILMMTRSLTLTHTPISVH